MDKSERQFFPPGDGDGSVEVIGGKNDRQMGAAVEAKRDFLLGDRDVGRHVDQVPRHFAA